MKSPIKAKQNQDSSDSDSEDSVGGYGAGLTPGSLDDTAEHRLLKKVVRLLKRQDEPNLGEIAELQRAAKKGVLQLMQLQLQHQSLKRDEDLKAKEAFANSYDDSIQIGPNPLENRDRYLMNGNAKEVIKYMDNIIFYKQKMIKLGKREPQDSSTFLNKKRAGGQEVENTKCNRYTRRFQNQPKNICKVARIASRLLYQLYEHDDKYVIDDLEKARLGLGSQDSGELLPCEEHGGEVATAKENKRQAYLQAIAFYEDLKDPRH